MYCPNIIYKCHDFTECNVLYRIRKKTKSSMDNHRDEKLSAKKSIVNILHGGLAENRKKPAIQNRMTMITIKNEKKEILQKLCLSVKLPGSKLPAPAHRAFRMLERS